MRWTDQRPEHDDLTGPPGGRLLGGTDGPVLAEVADRQFRHLIHHGRHSAPNGSGS